ncbi:peptidoglycan DD-metalloendopeptidase family protein [Shewanella sp. WXL01]|uniref:LysM peptidoglycan-binding domain-containing protein n=1 Tax=Shewanella maritima TaxID=2520507 RepID=A0A411PFA0_9GAMM|nr:MULTISPECIES: peptidoglycan DD-metalloendopeptidase family protein [Shewanella]NKF49768.1 peptidoglycan DD-metalloendopeptidase family protein [Shewanella sp. WXL01]QBF82154.1 LysM peptidoglycan-binding domain-containing protein [Shewanella maritima]
MKYSVWLAVSLFIALLCTGCSFQSHQAAPVESLSAKSKPKYDRGSLTKRWYKVKKGDTLYSIAWGAGKNYSDVARLNKLQKPYTIYPGQVLALYPKPAAPTSAKKATNVTKGVAITTAPATPITVKSSENQKQSVKFQSSTTANNRSKKELDRSQESAYSVTTTQQKVNQTVSQPVSTLPKKVKRWLWPVKGRIIGRFSASEQGNQGIKIAGNRGDIVKAAADGRVVYAGNALRGYGNLVIIKHNDDYLSAYAHADKIMVKEKQFVSAGQTVAKMGSTGTNKVMLHFEIRFHGKSVNPLKYLPKQ